MNKLTPEQFTSAFFEDPETGRIYLIEGRWEAHYQDSVLANPDGETGFVNLEDLLSILAGVGVRRMDVEWDGLAARQFEPTTEI